VVIAGLDRSSTARIRFILQELSLPNFYFSTCDMDEIASYKMPEFFFCMGNEINPPYPAIGALNIYHLQFPFPLRNVGGYKASRLIGYHSIVVNSEYTRHWTRTYLARLPEELQIQVVVVAPPVRDFDPIIEHDRNISLITVGRFFRAGHSKRQDIFLDILAETRRRVMQEVKGVMIGPVHDSADSKSYFDELNFKASNLGNTQIIRDASRDELAEHLQKSKFYIHAAGFHIAADIFPERAEHFGISVVEALKSGCIVGVYELGGPVEILSVVGGGFTYKSVEECASKIALIISGKLQIPALNHEALNNFSDKTFFDSIRRIASAH
jgi:glycosyltransferase involved in cell wall biosynthesis